MTTRPRLVILLIVMSLLVPGCTVAVPGRSGRDGAIPEIKKNCALCHNVQPVRKGAASLIKPLSEICVGCHADRIAPNEHRVDIVPSMPVGQLPLAEGKMTCVTCHNPHQNPYGSLLRMPEQALCLQCHPY